MYRLQTKRRGYQTNNQWVETTTITLDRGYRQECWAELWHHLSQMASSLGPAFLAFLALMIEVVVIGELKVVIEDLVALEAQA